MPPIRWALVGSSDFALDWIAPALRRAEGSALAAVISRDADRAAAAAARVGAAQSYTSIEAIDTSLVDGVVLVTANEAHAAGAIAAARRGLHVVVEKPMALSSADCADMIRAAREHSVMLAVAHCMEWAPPIVAARALLARGAIGAVRSARISASFLAEPGTVRRGGDAAMSDTATEFGALFDMGVHAIDAAARLLGPIVQVVAARLNADTGGGHIELECASGVRVQLSSSWGADENDFEITGDAGTISSSEWWGRSFSGQLSVRTSGGEVAEPLPLQNVYEQQYAHLAAAARQEVPLLISGERGARNIAVIEAIARSARSGHSATIGT